MLRVPLAASVSVAFVPFTVELLAGAFFSVKSPAIMTRDVDVSRSRPIWFCFTFVAFAMVSANTSPIDVSLSRDLFYMKQNNVGI